MTPDPNLVEDLRLLAPMNPAWVWGAGVAVALLLVGVWVVRRWRRQSRGVPSAAEQQAAYVDALAALAQLAGLLTPAQSRAYAIASSKIVGHFIEGRFGIRAPFQATEEFLGAASRSPVLEPRHRELLADYLGRCDLLKFAQQRADQPELVGLHDAAVRFVAEATPAPNAPKAAGAECRG